MAEHHYNAKLDIPSDADSARFFVPTGYIARLEEGALVVEPEESEDERIRKAVFKAFSKKDVRDVLLAEGVKVSEALSWLEKQKEQKPDIELIQHSWYMEGYFTCKHKREPKWIIKTGEGGPKYEKNPRYGLPLEEEQKPEWSEEDEKMVETICKEGDLKPSEQRWLKSLKNRGNSPQSNTNSPSWSEEDEKQIRQIERIVKNAGCSKMLQEKIHNWLKSLRPQPHWKPSEEQMRCLQTVVQEVNKKSLMSTTGYSPAAVLQSLYIDLKALM